MAQKQIEIDKERKSSAIALLRSDLRAGRRKKHDITVLLEENYTLP